MDEPRPDDNPSEQPDQSAKQPDPSEQQPVDISADVDALLAEASALADQIADDTGAEVDADGTPALGPADAMAADPKAAVDDVEAKLAELESLVNEAAADGATPGDGALADSSEHAVEGAADALVTANAEAAFGEESQSAAGDDDVADDQTEGGADGKAEDTDASDDDLGFETEATRNDKPQSSHQNAPKAEAAKTSNEFADEAFDESLVGDVEVSLDESIVDEPEDFGLDAGESKAAALRKPLAKLIDAPKKVLASVKKIFARGFFQRLGDTIIFRAIWAGLELIDGPFAGLSPAAKRNIGIIGIITLICGILSLVLPGLFESNPYLDMVADP